MQVLIELDPETLRRLEKVAPARSRKRSAFIRGAVQKALWEIEEQRTRQAYADAPDGEEPPFDPAVWESAPYGGFDPPAAEPTKPAKRPAKRKKAAKRSASPKVRSKKSR